MNCHLKILIQLENEKERKEITLIKLHINNKIFI